MDIGTKSKILSIARVLDEPEGAKHITQVASSYFLLFIGMQKVTFCFTHKALIKAKKLKTFLENKRMILKEDKFYKFNPDFYY